jgi:hypothetical protein
MDDCMAAGSARRSWRCWPEFLMYPQAETAAGRLDRLDPDTFVYTITAREVAA